MGDHKESEGESRWREGSNTGQQRWNHKNPPSVNWKPSIPSWEKKFCTSICLISWKKICETKRDMYLFQDVVQWDDSAGKEAFQNAKSRFWARINDLPCRIPIPDPDIYIDEIDWDNVIDPQLLKDLEKIPSVNDEEKDRKSEPVIYGLETLMMPDQVIPSTGWGDEVDEVKQVMISPTKWEPEVSTQKVNNSSMGWVDKSNSIMLQTWNSNNWENREGNENGNENQAPHSTKWRRWNNGPLDLHTATYLRWDSSKWDKGNKKSDPPCQRNDRIQGERRINSGKKESRACFSKKAWRVHDAEHQMQIRPDNYRGNKGINLSYEQSTMNKQHSDLVI